MKNTKNLILLPALLVLLLVFSACVSGDVGSTPATDPTETTTLPTAPEETIPPTQPEETSAPSETEPGETELQFQDREPDGTPLTTAQLQEVFSVITESDPEHWYETIFIQDFTDPSEMNFFLLFGDGIPAERASAELTPGEENFFVQIGKESVLHFDVDRIPREKVESVLCTYFDLTAEDLEQLDMENWPGVPYFPETDCFYGTNNSYNGDTPYFQEGYRMEDGTLAIYYYRYRTRVTEGTLCRAVIRLDPESNSYKVLAITKVEP